MSGADYVGDLLYKISNKYVLTVVLAQNSLSMSDLQLIADLAHSTFKSIPQNRPNY